MRSLLLRAAAACVLVMPLLSTLAADADPAAVDEETLRATGVPTDGPGLVAHFRKQARAAPTREQVFALVKRLGDDLFEVREKATASLIALGTGAEPFLRQALEEQKRGPNLDMEVLRRAEDCLRRLGDRAAAAQDVAAAVRTLARRQAPGAVEALLEYLPNSPAESATDEIQNALTVLAARDAKPNPAFALALRDKDPISRAVAGAALARHPGNPARTEVLKLLVDPELEVRRRVAFAHAQAGGKEAVSTLINLLVEYDQAKAYPIEEFLCRLAGEEAPDTVWSKEPGKRAKCRDAWASWWEKNAAKIDVAKAAAPARLLGYTMIVLLEQGRVLELDANNKTRWEVRGVDFPLDAQLLSGGRILLAEQKANRVTERDLKGKVIWEKSVVEPLMAQRLPNGNTFITAGSMLIEVDRDGKEVFTRPSRDGAGYMRGQKLSNGEIALVTGRHEFKRLDPTGNRELQSFPVNVETRGGRIEVLPNNHVLVPEKDQNRVAEYDTGGRVAWHVSVRQPIAAIRLANGNTLVTSMADQRAVEFNRRGEEVWEYRSDTKVTRAFRR